MSYDFSLDRKKTILVSTISIVLALLIFMSGWIAGIMANISRIPGQEIQPSGQRAAAVSTPESKPPAATKQPIADKQVTAPERNSHKPDAAASSQEAAEPEVPSPVQAKPQPEKTTAVMKDTPPLSPATPKGVQRGTQSEGALQAGTSKGSMPSEAPKKLQPPQKPLAQKEAFTVQVQSCIVMQNALRSANDLKKKGYEVLILKKHGPRDKTWYAVQFGEYKDRGEASRTASWFTEKEKTVAVVMPIAPYQLKGRKSPESFAQNQDKQSGDAQSKPETE
jgi:hypothetical protein